MNGIDEEQLRVLICYFAVVIVIAVLAHAIIRPFLAALGAIAAILFIGTCIAIVAYGAISGHHINLGFVPMTAFYATMFGMPFALLAGLPFLMIRRARQMRTPIAGNQAAPRL